MSLDICKEIGNIIMNRNTKGLGLLNGNAGISVFYYHLANSTSNKKYLKHADFLVDEIYKGYNFNINFQDGIAGSGWCIEYLIQNNFCKGNANEILKDIDTRIFKYLNEQNEIPLNLQLGLIGFLMYIMIRIKNKRNHNPVGRRIRQP